MTEDFRWVLIPSTRCWDIASTEPERLVLILANLLFTNHPTVYIVASCYTNSLQQSPSWEADIFSASQEISRILWKPEGSSPYSQLPDTCRCPELDQSSPYPHIPLLEDPF